MPCVTFSFPHPPLERRTSLWAAICRRDGALKGYASSFPLGISLPTSRQWATV
jgi:hypothetical protein